MLLHPRAGTKILQSDSEVKRNIENFKIPHTLDKVYLKYYPERKDNLLVYPACLRSDSLHKLFKTGKDSLLSGTIKNF